jgi:hypothetical protein
LEFDTVEDKFKYTYIGTYNPLSTKLFNFIIPFIWPNGWTSPPTDTRTYSQKCPFPDGTDEPSFVGKVIAGLASLTVLLLTVAISITIFKRFWRVSVIPIDVRTEFSQADMILAFGLFADFLQYISMGPDFSDIVQFVATMSEAASLDLANLLTFEEGVFWFVLNVTIGLCVTMFVLYLFNTFGIKDKLPQSGIMANLKTFSDMMLPILGELAFLPIIATLIEVYNCTETTGDDITDAFLHKDCY